MNQGKMVKMCKATPKQTDFHTNMDSEFILSLNENQWNMIFDPIDDWITLTDTVGKVIRTNSSGQDFTGLSSEKMVGQSVCKLIHKSICYSSVCPVQEMVRTGKAIDMEKKLSDGKHLNITVKPVKDKKNNVRAALLIVRDITEKKELEQNLAIRDNAIEMSINPIAIIDFNGFLTYVNNAFISVWNYETKEEVTGRHYDCFWKPVKALQERIKVMCKGSGGGWMEEVPATRKDGSSFFVRISSSLIKGKNQETHSIMASFLETTENKRIEKEREWEIELLRIINAKSQEDELLKSILTFLKDISKCDAAGIRLKESEDYPYYLSYGFPNNFVRAENFLCSKSSEGKMIYIEHGRPYLKCMCGNIISGRIDKSKSFFTDFGSFWTNSTTELLAGTTPEDRQAKTRNRCNTAGYESVALIPLRNGNDTFGLIQLNAKQKNCFTVETISFFEKLADSIAASLAKRRFETKYQKSEENYRILAENMNEGLCRIDAQGRFLYVNDKYREIIGYPDENLIGKSWMDFFDEETRNIINNKLEERINGFTQKYEMVHTKNNGQKVYIRVSPKAIFDEDGIYKGSITILTDITREKEQEEKLKEERNLIRLLIDHIPERIFVKDLDHRFIITNKEVVRYEGFNDERELLGKTDFDLYPQKLARKFFNEEEEILRTCQPIINRENFFIDKHGREQYVLTTKVPLKDSNKNVIGLIGIHHFITEHKNTQKALKESINRFKGIFDQSPIAISIYDNNGLLVDLNPKFMELFGATCFDDIKNFNLFEDTNLPKYAIMDIFKKEKFIIKQSLILTLERKRNFIKLQGWEKYF